MRWGRPVPPEMVEKIDITWGARAIFQRGYIDLLPDRQSMESLNGIPSEQAEKDFLRWLNHKALPTMRKQCSSVGQEEDVVEVFDEGPYHIEASPQRSYGYLYLRAWRVKP